MQKSQIDRLGFDPESVECRRCWAKVKEPCIWPPDPRTLTDHPEAFHAERIEDAEFDASAAAAIAGTAPDAASWQADLRNAAEALV
jgi:hypothetical protein